MHAARPRTSTGDTGEGRLERHLGLLLATAVVVNATIGTGIFKTPAQVARQSGSIATVFAVWIGGAIIALCGTLSLAKLAAAFPRSGGLYEYLRRAWGPRVAFVFGWSKLTLLIPSAVGSFARLGGEALASLLGLGAGWSTALSIGVLAVCAAVNVLAVRRSVTQQAILTALKYAGVLGLAVVGVGAAIAGKAPPLITPQPHDAGILGAFGALVAVMWAYDGWADLTSIAGEVKDPARTLPRALVLGTLAVAVVYLLANVGYALVLGLDGLRASTAGSNMAGANLVRAALGPWAWNLFTVVLVISCVSGCMSSLLTGSRVFVPMATDGVFIKALGRVSERAKVPATAVLVAAALGALYISFRSFEQLSDGFVCGYFPFYILGVLALFRLRMPIFPLVPVVFLLGAGCLLAGAIAAADRTALFSLGVVALGVPLSWLW